MGIFPNRLGHGFGQKCKISFNYPFKLGKIGQESV